jgi:hypothetical protein
MPMRTWGRLKNAAERLIFWLLPLPRSSLGWGMPRRPLQSPFHARREGKASVWSPARLKVGLRFYLRCPNRIVISPQDFAFLS